MNKTFVTMELINKADLVAEIEKRKSVLQSRIAELGTCESNTLGLFQDMDLYDDILFFLDTLEVKEVDLEKEIQQHINDCLDIKFPTTDIKLIAKDVEYTARKFFELGLKTKKGK